MSENDATRTSTGAKSQAKTTGGWLSSSGSIDHGRFAPGTVLDNRYRILGLLGRGGMGEVYKADDLRLGQAVALKFLPADLARDSVRLAQFHNEVRTARQVSHPSVCRMYDIGEIDGELFLTMEYVDGEDLSSLLRRIGRLPEDKALDIARQIAAGLAAAHERGVLHRDLKPANIMLDGSGKVRIMDFSLAAIGEVTDVRAGTPAYMAPEQLSGQEVTSKSDIYALGLVLYELFTGRRAFDAKTLSELVEQHQSGSITAPTEIVKVLDPTIERALMRCLEPDPARRPRSALAVSASLPGGDPLAAALAAGETPSPEMVAAAGGESAALTPVAGVTWLAITVVMLLTVAWLMGRTSLLSRVPLEKSAAVLADRADELRQSLGYTEQVADRAWYFEYDQPYLNWVQAQPSGATRWSDLPSGRPSALRFWFRTSPQVLIPQNTGGSVTSTDPPLVLNGMTKVTLDTKGRLILFHAAPAQVEATGPAPPPVDWDKLFTAAALDRSAFAEVTPGRTPATFADERRAWRGTLPGTTVDVHIEAAAYRGRPVSFDIVAPWTPADREPSDDSDSIANAVIVAFLLVIAAVTAWVNVKSGRADRRGAYRLAVFTFFIVVAAWLVGDHLASFKEEQQRMFVRIGIGLFLGGVLYLIYLGLEPFVRRNWPTMLVGWSRLLGGRIRDPLIGRDVLIGAAFGAGLAALNLAAPLLTVRFGLPEPTPHQSALDALLGNRAWLETLIGAVNNGLQNALILLFEFAGVRALVERLIRTAAAGLTRAGLNVTRFSLSPAAADRVFLALAVAIVTMVAVLNNNAGGRVVDAACQALSTNLVLLVLLRIGLFASTIMFTVNVLVLRVPMTLNTAAFYGNATWFTIALIVIAAAIGLWMARAGEPLFGERRQA